MNVKGTFLCSRCRPAVHGRPRRRANRQRLVERSVLPDRGRLRRGDGLGLLAGKAAVMPSHRGAGSGSAPPGVHVFAISPGTVKTDMTASTFAGNWDDPDFWSPPELAAELVSFIASGALDALSGRSHSTQRRTTGGRSRTAAPRSWRATCTRCDFAPSKAAPSCVRSTRTGEAARAVRRTTTWWTRRRNHCGAPTRFGGRAPLDPATPLDATTQSVRLRGGRRRGPQRHRALGAVPAAEDPRRPLRRTPAPGSRTRTDIPPSTRMQPARTRSASRRERSAVTSPGRDTRGRSGCRRTFSSTAA